MIQALLALLFVLSVSADVQQEEGVYVLGEDNFDDFIKSNEHVLVEFYAPWCGHCKSLAPEYASAASSLEASGSSVKLAKVDATVHAGLGSRFGVQGYPTLKFFRSGTANDYDGGRKSADIVSWVTKKSGPSSVELGSQDAIDKFIANDGVKVVAYLTAANLDTWMAATKDARFSEFLAAHVPASAWGNNKEGVTIYKTNEEPIHFDGEFQTDAILTFVSSEGYPLVEELAQPIWMRSQKTGQALLAVFHEEADSSAQELLFKVAKAHKGKALFSWSTRIQLLEQWGATGKFVPSAIMIIWVGQEPKFRIWNEDNGVAFDEEGLNAFVSESLAGTYASYKKSEPVPAENPGPGNVVTVVGKNFADVVYAKDSVVFVEFYAPWCGHCKKLAPVWDELAQQVKDLPNVVIAKIDATANSLPDEISVTGFPTLILFKGTAQTVYSGARDADSLATFVREAISGPASDDKVDL